mgnify:CR=1 FL=1
MPAATTPLNRDRVLRSGVRLADAEGLDAVTMRRLADELGVSRQTVISLEKGRYDPSLPLAFRLAAVFGRRIEDLFTPDGNAG